MDLIFLCENQFDAKIILFLLSLQLPTLFRACCLGPARKGEHLRERLDSPFASRANWGAWRTGTVSMMGQKNPSEGPFSVYVLISVFHGGTLVLHRPCPDHSSIHRALSGRGAAMPVGKAAGLVQRTIILLCFVHTHRAFSGPKTSVCACRVPPRGPASKLTDGADTIPPLP